MRKLTSAEFANAFIWLTALAASIILFREADRLWMMIAVMMVCGTTSICALAGALRQAE